MSDHIYPLLPETETATEAEEIEGEWAELRSWWYLPVVTLLWIAVVSAALSAPALVLAVWRALL